MIVLNNLGRYRKGRIWLNDLPDIHYDAIEILKDDIYQVSSDTWKGKSLCLELLLLPRHASNYALLGIEYIPELQKHIELEVFVSKDRDMVFENSLIKKLSFDDVHVGIPKQYAGSIFQVALEALKNGIFPPGRLKFNIGAHGLVGSSRLIFSQITRILLRIIVNDLNSLKKEDIERLISEELYKNFS